MREQPPAKKYLCTDGRRKWYSDTIEFDYASGLLTLDEGRRAFVSNPSKFKYFVCKPAESKPEGATT